MRHLLLILPLLLALFAVAQDDVIATRIRALAGDDREARALAEQELLLIGEPAIKPLAAALGDAKTGPPAQRVLIRFGAPSVNPLIGVLLGKDAAARVLAVEALGAIGDVRALDPTIAAMRDTDASVRLAAVEALAHLPDRRGSPALIDALGDADARVVTVAAEALARRDEAAAARPMVLALSRHEDIPAALVQLGEPGAEALLAAVTAHAPSAAETRAMGLFRDARFAGPLKAALRATDRAIRLEAAVGLGLLRDAAAVEPLLATLADPDPKVRIAAAEALGAIGDPRAVPALVKAMGGADATLQNVALTALGRIGNLGAIGALLATLKAGTPALRAGAAQWLGIQGDPKAADGLAAAMRDADPAVADAALEALARMADPRAVTALIAALKGPNTAAGKSVRADSRRLRLAEWLAYYPHLQALPLWAALAQQDTDPQMRETAVRALANYTDPRALDALADVVRNADNDEDTAGATFFLSRTRTPWAARVLIARYKGLWYDASRIGGGMQPKPPFTWAEFGAPAVEPLLAAVNTTDANQRAWAVAALAEIGDARATRAFQAAAAGDDPRTRIAGLLGLAAVKDPTAFDLLAKALRDTEHAMRVAAVQGLGKLGDPRGTDLLIPILGDAALRRTAVLALADLKDPKAVPALAALLPTTESATRPELVAALAAAGPTGMDALLAHAQGMTGLSRYMLVMKLYGGARDPRIMTILEEATAYDGPLGPSARALLADCEGPRADALRRRMARNADGVARAGGAMAAASIPGAEGAALLRHLLGDQDGSVRAFAILSLASRDGRAALPALIPQLTDPDEFARSAAHAALVEAAGSDQGRTVARWRAWAKAQGLG